MAAEFRIATMSRIEVDLAIGLASGEGWNPGLDDAAAFHATDPEGFLVGKLDEVPIGCISAIRYPDGFGFIGLYIVVPEFRGKGFGIQLWNAAMRRLEGCNIGLDGVLAQQENYRRSGFRLEYSNIRFERTGALPAATAATVATANDVVGIERIPFEQLVEFDRTAFPSARDSFIQAWLRQPERFGLASLVDGELRGYGMIRKAQHGSKVGPLFARDGATAERLYLALCRNVPSDVPVFLDVPEVNRDAMQLAHRYAMQPVFGTARMYTGIAPDIALDRVFGVTTFELG